MCIRDRYQPQFRDEELEVKELQAKVTARHQIDSQDVYKRQPQNAITVWKDHMVSQGFGYKLGVDLPGEMCIRDSTTTK